MQTPHPTFALTGSCRKALACALAAALVSLAALTGCSAPAEAPDAASSSASVAEAPEMIVTMAVTSPGADGQVAYSGELALPAGATALEALQATGLVVTSADSEYGAFVEAVEGLANEGMKGWTYTVNGEQVQASADKTELAPGDSVEWSYIEM